MRRRVKNGRRWPGCPNPKQTPVESNVEQRGHRSEVIGGGWPAEGRAGGVRTRSKLGLRVRAHRCPVASKDAGGGGKRVSRRQNHARLPGIVRVGLPLPCTG